MKLQDYEEKNHMISEAFDQLKRKHPWRPHHHFHQSAPGGYPLVQKNFINCVLIGSLK